MTDVLGWPLEEARLALAGYPLEVSFTGGESIPGMVIRVIRQKPIPARAGVELVVACWPAEEVSEAED